MDIRDWTENDVLDRLADRQAIVDAMHAYCRLTDLNRPEEQVLLFTEMGRVNYGPGEIGWVSGRPALLALLQRALSAYKATSHQISNIEIHFEDSDHAEAISAVHAWHRRREGPDFQLFGRYHDRWRRTTEGWRLEERRLKAAGAVADDVSRLEPLGREIEADRWLGSSPRPEGQPSDELLALLRKMTDEREIVALTVRYCWALDTRCFDELRRVFMPNAVADYGKTIGVLAGVDAIAGACQQALGRLDASQHIVANHDIVVEGDSASSRCYFHAQHVRREAADGANFIVAGIYTDDLVRTAEGWRIRHRTLTPLWREGNPQVTAR